ncbi:MAG: lysylphosphatidylglycerol synthase transmembrane domain-containing protein [Gemmatimonadaceae bacterium]
MIRTVLRWAVTIAIFALLVLFARTVDWGAAWIAMRGASIPLLLLAFAANTASVLLRIIRWWLFLRPAGAPSLAMTMKAGIAGVGLNNVLLANGGEAARVVFVARATGLPAATVLATITLERMFDIVGFMVMLVGGILVFPLPENMERYRIPAMVLMALIFAGLAYFVYSSRNTTPESIARPQLEPGPATGLGAKIRLFLRGFAQSMGALASGPRFVIALALSILAWLGQIATFAFAAMAAGLEVPIAASLAALLAVNLGLILRATPGNVGFFQFAYALTVERFGIPREPAIAVSLLIQTLQVIPVTLIGVALAPEFVFRKRGAATAES